MKNKHRKKSILLSTVCAAVFCVSGCGFFPIESDGGGVKSAAPKVYIEISNSKLSLYDGDYVTAAVNPAGVAVTFALTAPVEGISVAPDGLFSADAAVVWPSTPFSVAASGGGAASEPVVFTYAGEKLRVQITNTNAEVYNGDFITASANRPAAVTFALKSPVAGISVDELTGRITVSDGCADGTEFYAVASAGDAVSDAVGFVVKKPSVAIDVAITNSQSVLTSGAYVTASATADGEPYSDAPVTFRLKTAVSGVSIDSSDGRVTIEHTVTNGTEFTVIASCGGFDSPEKTFTTYRAAVTVAVNITNGETSLKNGEYITAAAITNGQPYSGDPITFRLKTPVSGVSVDENTGRVTIAPTVPNATVFTVIASCGGFDSPERAFATEKTERLTIDTEGPDITSGTALEYTCESASSEQVVFSLKESVAGVAVSEGGVVTFVYSTAVGKSFTVRVRNATGTLEAEKTFTASEYFFDDFTNGVSYDDWYISNKKWGGTAAGGNNNGVKPQNVQYTADGKLVLWANGDYHPTANQRRVGAAIAAKEPHGAGKYEVRMKVCPRLGACSTIWPFFYDNDGIINHEIDIEIPGKVSPTAANGYPSFESLLTTPWTGENVYTTTYHQTATPANDGEWHTYRIDWHTDAPTGAAKRVDFYVDGALIHTETKTIPTIDAAFWIGVWFPASGYTNPDDSFESGWAGTPNFERDKMVVDWFRFTPFNEGGGSRETAEKYRASVGDPGKVATQGQYPSSPVAITETENYVSNASFDGVPAAWTLSGGASVAASGGRTGAKALTLPSGGSANQVITGVYGGYKFDVSAYARGGAGVLKIEFLSFANTVLGTAVTANISAVADYTERFASVTAPQGSKKMRITFTATGETLYIDDARASLKKN
jgi:hypothetical protein